MPHLDSPAMLQTKKHTMSKPLEFHVRKMDDGNFHVKVMNTNYEENKEMMATSLEDVFKKMHGIFGSKDKLKEEKKEK